MKMNNNNKKLLRSSAAVYPKTLFYNVDCIVP